VVGRVAEEREGSKEESRQSTVDSEGEDRKWKMKIGEEQHVWAGEGFLMRKCEGWCAGMKRGCRVEKKGEEEGNQWTWSKGEVPDDRAGELMKSEAMRGWKSWMEV
jgi:hypothetical protein